MTRSKELRRIEGALETGGPRRTQMGSYRVQVETPLCHEKRGGGRWRSLLGRIEAALRQAGFEASDNPTLPSVMVAQRQSATSRQSRSSAGPRRDQVSSLACITHTRTYMLATVTDAGLDLDDWKPMQTVGPGVREAEDWQRKARSGSRRRRGMSFGRLGSRRKNRSISSSVLTCSFGSRKLSRQEA